MIIQEIPTIFQPTYKSNYPEYSSGKNIEEICFQYFLENKDSINSEYIYLPVFWTSYYVLNQYGENIQPLYDWLDTLDKNKNFFTIVQYASGIYIRNPINNILVFSAGGGGLNNKSNCMREEFFFGLKRHIFYGNAGNYSIPLICLPTFPCLNIERDIYCSFMGRFDTHKCRIIMNNLLKNDKQFYFYNSVDFNTYKNILNRSIFTLAPRGCGYTSFRIYEAIIAGSIPIYIWEDKKILPFEDILNWNDFSIIIHENDIEKLPNILKNIDINKLQENLDKIKHWFSFDKIFNYITNKLI
jgi:hypothetical protein